MKKIVVITTPGTAKKYFVNQLFYKTEGAVKLVVIQNDRRKSLFERFKKFAKKTPIYAYPREIWALLNLHYRKDIRDALMYQKCTTIAGSKEDVYLPTVMRTDSLRTEEVYTRIQEVKPDVIVIWGGLIVPDRILSVAQVAVNMHAGYCPYYRGTNCNYTAILNNDLAHVGITIHKAVSNVDAGAILRIVTVDMNQKPSVFFRQLNDTAIQAYMDVIYKMCMGEEVGETMQDLSLGKNYLLKDWSYAKQYKIARTLYEMEHSSKSG